MVELPDAADTKGTAQLGRRPSRRAVPSPIPPPVLPTILPAGLPSIPLTFSQSVAGQPVVIVLPSKMLVQGQPTTASGVAGGRHLSRTTLWRPRRAAAGATAVLLSRQLPGSLLPPLPEPLLPPLPEPLLPPLPESPLPRLSRRRLGPAIGRGRTTVVFAGVKYLGRRYCPYNPRERRSLAEWLAEQRVARAG